MSAILALVAVLLSSLGLAAAVWGLRQRAVLERVHAGLRTLQEGIYDIRLRRETVDTEPVLQSFDALAQILGARRVDAAGPAAAQEQLLPRLAEVLRPSLLSIQEAVTRLLGESTDPSRATELLSLRLRVANLLGVFDRSADWSALRRGLSALRRESSADAAARSPAVLLVGPECSAAEALCGTLAATGIDSLIVPGRDAAAALVAMLRPPFVLFDAAWTGSWRAALNLQRINPAPVCPWLYTLPQGDGRGHLWTPRDLWFWPRDDSVRMAGDDWLQSLGPATVAVTGPPSLAPALAQGLTDRGIRSTIREPMAADDLWATVHATGSDTGVNGTSDYILVIAQATVEHEPERLCQAFVALRCPREPQDLAEAHRMLLDRLLGSARTARGEPTIDLPQDRPAS